MFRIKNTRRWKQTLDKMKEDIADEIIGRIKQEAIITKGHYDRIGDSFYYDPINFYVRSDSPAAIFINQGRAPGAYAPIDKLVAWVLADKEPGISIKAATAIAWKVNHKLYNEGIEPKWYVDDALFEMEQDHE